MSLSANSPQQAGSHDRSERISRDELFQVLSNSRRRYAVHLLKQEDEDVELGSMATQIAAWENGNEISEVTGTQRKRVYTSLQQQHLPKMDDVGVVEFDKNRGVVEPTPSLEEVDLYFDIVRSKEIPWSEYYLGLSLVCASLVAAVGIGAWPFTLVSEFSWLVFVVVAFMFSALAHKYYIYQMGKGEQKEPPVPTD